MGNAAEVRHYFLEAFTPGGIFSLLPELLSKVEHTYLFTGRLGTGKSTMIKLLGIQLIDRGNDADYIRSIREPDSVAGLYLPKQKMCILDKSEFVSQGFRQLNVSREIDFDFYCRQNKLERYYKQIKKTERSLQEIEQNIIQQLKIDYPLKDDFTEENNNHWPELSSNGLINLEKLFLHDLMGLISPENKAAKTGQIINILSQIKRPNLSFYFLQGLYLDGWLNIAPRYIREYDRIFLEGGDSTDILVDILQEVKNLEQKIEIIVHPLTPYSILGLVFPERKLAVWRGDPCKLQEQGFICKHNSQMTLVLEKYKTTRFVLKSYVNEILDYNGLDDLRSELQRSILSDFKKESSLRKF